MFSLMYEVDQIFKEQVQNRKDFVITKELPGWGKEDVEIYEDGGILEIRVGRSGDGNKKIYRYDIGRGVDNEVSAEMKNGLLKINVKKKKIDIEKNKIEIL